jgi:acetyl/propionyl-CoA carboxylase alpha subunit
VPPALAGNARLAAAVARAGLIWVGPDPEVLERLGGDGVEPASERGLLAWVTDDGPRHLTAVCRDRAAGIARVSWTPAEPQELPAAVGRLAEVGWRGLVTVGVDPDGELAEVAAGFSLDMAVLERAHGVDAVELALRSAVPSGADGLPGEEPPGLAAVAAQLRATLAPGVAGRVTGRLPGTRPRRGGAAPEDLPAGVTAVSGYEPGDRIDGWYDALLATVGAAAPDVTGAALAVSQALSGLADTGVPHDGPEVCGVLQRLADGTTPAG